MERVVTLITGTRKGIGAYLAQHYLKKGHFVIGCSRNNFEWSCSEIDNYCHYQLDVADEMAVKKMFSDIRKRFGKIDNLINNAGIAAMNHSILTPVDVLQKVFSTNAFGTFLMSREAFKIMKKNNYGRIVNFSTVAVPLKLDGEAVYAASKASIVSLTQIMAKEFGKDGITVNAVGPTPVQTDLIKNVPKDKIEKLLNSQSIQRFGEYQDVANVVDFYLQKQSDFVTGQVIYLGGL